MLRTRPTQRMHSACTTRTPPTHANTCYGMLTGELSRLPQDAGGGGWFFHARTPTPAAPLVGGMEYAGVVLSVGPSVQHLAPGDRVLGLQDVAFQKMPGTWAERTVAPEPDVVKFPPPPPGAPELTFAQAAATAMAAFVSGDMCAREASEGVC